METRPRITIITVTMNDRVGLHRTVESIREQDFESIEHVVVDGASSDGTPEWLSTYAAPYDVITVSESDDGIFDAMNKGASLATGDLIVFMNSADTFADTSVLSWIAEDWSRDKWEWAYGQLEYLSEGLESRGESDQHAHSQRALELGTRFAPHQATFMSRDLFLRLGGFDVAFEYACDQELALRAGRIFEPRVYDRVIAKFLLGGTHSQTTYWRREMIYHRMRVRNSALIAGHALPDRVYSLSMAGYRELRECLSQIWNQIRVRASRVKSP